MSKRKGPALKNGRHRCISFCFNLYPCDRHILAEYAAQEGVTQTSLIDGFIQTLKPKLKEGGLESSTSVAK